MCAQELGAIHVEAEDLSDGCGSKFSVIVVHDGFEGALSFLLCVCTAMGASETC